MGLGRGGWSEARETIQSLLSNSNGVLRDNQELRAKAFVSQTTAKMHLPATIGCHLDFRGL